MGTPAEDALRRALEKENQIRTQTNDPGKIAAATAERQAAAAALTDEQNKKKKPAAPESQSAVWNWLSH